MMSVTIDPTEIRAPTGPAKRPPNRTLLLALPVGLCLTGLAGVCAIAMWPTQRSEGQPPTAQNAVANIADWPEIKDGVPQLVSRGAAPQTVTTASVVSRAIADAQPSSDPAQPAAPLARESSRPFVPVEGTAGPLSPAPFEPAPARIQASSTTAAAPLPEAAPPVAARVIEVPTESAATSAQAAPAPVPTPPVVAAVTPADAPVTGAITSPATAAEAQNPAPSGLLRGAVPAQQPEGTRDNPAPSSRAAAAATAKATARQDRAPASREATSAAKPVPKKADKVAAPATKKPEPVRAAGGVPQAGAAGAVASATPPGEAAKPAAEEDRVRVFGMPLPGFVPTGRKIKETVGNLGDAVMSLPGKL